MWSVECGVWSVGERKIFKAQVGDWRRACVSNVDFKGQACGSKWIFYFLFRNTAFGTPNSSMIPR